MSAVWIGLGAYLGALAVALVWMVALGRAAQLGDEIEMPRGAGNVRRLGPRTATRSGASGKRRHSVRRVHAIRR